MPNNPPYSGGAKKPFTMIDTSERAKFFGLLNNFNDSLNVPAAYYYKFNLHMETIGYTIDQPQHIPFVIDPVIQNDGPPK